MTPPPTPPSAPGADIPDGLAARLDRLPFARLRTTILLALGGGWLFDSFEVQLFGSAVGPLCEHFSGSVFEQDLIFFIVGTLDLPDLATRLGAGVSYLLVALFWLAGRWPSPSTDWRAASKAPDAPRSR